MGNWPGIIIQSISSTFVNSPYDSTVTFTLNNLLHVPSISKNLSVSKFAKANKCSLNLILTLAMSNLRLIAGCFLKALLVPMAYMCFPNSLLLQDLHQQLKQMSLVRPIISVYLACLLVINLFHVVLFQRYFLLFLVIVLKTRPIIKQVKVPVHSHWSNHGSTVIEPVIVKYIFLILYNRFNN